MAIDKAKLVTAGQSHGFDQDLLQARIGAVRIPQGQFDERVVLEAVLQCGQKGVQVVGHVAELHDRRPANQAIDVEAMLFAIYVNNRTVEALFEVVPHRFSVRRHQSLDNPIIPPTASGRTSRL